MSDMTAVIAPKSDQINADDLIGRTMTITITAVSVRAGQEQPVSISFEGSTKVFRPCKSMGRVMVQAWGADSKNYVGKSMTLYRDPKVKWGGMEVGGIRISHMSHIERGFHMMLSESKAKRTPHEVKLLVASQVTQTTTQGPTETQAFAAARAAAARGIKAFTAWWNSDEGKTMREAARAILPELQATAKAADESTSDDPFGLPPATDMPTPEQLAAAERAAMEALAAEKAKYEGVAE
jgi:hypothetical protein